MICGLYIVVFYSIKIATLKRCLNPMQSFCLFPVRIGQFTHKMSLISTLMPSLRNIGAN